MGLIVATLLFAIPLMGLWPDKHHDGWTMLRDRVAVACAVAGLLWVALHYLAFAIIFALVLGRFGQTSDTRQKLAGRLGYNMDLHALMLWLGIFSLWVLFQSLDAEQTALAVMVLILAGVVQVCFAVVDTVNRKCRPKENLPISGTLGQKTYLATYLTIIAPLVASRELWWLLAIFAVGVFLTKTRMPIIIFVISVSFAWPSMAVWLMLLGLFAVPYVQRKLPSWRKDSLPIRLYVWRLTWAYGKQWPFWLIGRGHNSFAWHSLRWSMQYRLKEAYVHTHNDYLQFFFEYGAIGVAAIAIFAFPLVGQLRLGHGMSGSVIAIALCSAYNFPTHIAPIGVTILFLISALSKGLL